MRILLDESLPHRLPLSLAVLAGRDNRFETLLPLVAQLLARLPDLRARTFIRCDG
jgi:hypothetical protein